LEELKGNLHLIDAPRQNTKTLFFEQEGDLEKYETSLQKEENHQRNYNYDKERLETMNVFHNFIDQNERFYL